MNLRLGVALALFCSAGAAIAEVGPGPYPYVPVSPGKHNIALTSATGLIIPSTYPNYATVCFSTATTSIFVRYTTDGTTTPTAAIGMPASGGQCVPLLGRLAIGNFKAIQSGGVATMDYEFFQ